MWNKLHENSSRFFLFTARFDEGPAANGGPASGIGRDLNEGWKGLNNSSIGNPLPAMTEKITACVMASTQIASVGSRRILIALEMRRICPHHAHRDKTTDVLSFVKA